MFEGSLSNGNELKSSKRTHRKKEKKEKKKKKMKIKLCTTLCVQKHLIDIIIQTAAALLLTESFSGCCVCGDTRILKEKKPSFFFESYMSIK